MTEVQQDLEKTEQPNSLFGDDWFQWVVAEGGYTWRDATVVNLPWAKQAGVQPGGVHRILTDGQSMAEPPRLRDYRPFDHADLYITFADTDPTEDGVARFANRWGLLGAYIVDIDLRPPRRALGRRLPEQADAGQGEVLAVWRREIEYMREALRVWRAPPGQKRKPRGGLLHYKAAATRIEGRCWEFVGPTPDGNSAELIFDSQGGRNQASEMTWVPSRALTRRWINCRLADWATARLVWDPESGQHLIRVHPVNLLGALWLQFARAIAGGVEYRPCKVCQKWLTISAEVGGFRVDREFCGPACRQKDHRRKVREAREMKAAGLTVKQIAKRLDTGVEHIRNWLTKEK